MGKGKIEKNESRHRLKRLKNACEKIYKNTPVVTLILAILFFVGVAFFHGYVHVLVADWLHEDFNVTSIPTPIPSPLPPTTSPLPSMAPIVIMYYPDPMYNIIHGLITASGIIIAALITTLYARSRD